MIPIETIKIVRLTKWYIQNIYAQRTGDTNRYITNSCLKDRSYQMRYMYKSCMPKELRYVENMNNEENLTIETATKKYVKQETLQKCHNWDIKRLMPNELMIPIETLKMYA